MSNYKVIQLTNSAIGAVGANTMLPLGTITRKIQSSNNCCSTFNVTTTDSNIIYLNEPGYYRITYSGSVIAGAAGVVDISIIANSDSVYTASATAAEGDTVNITIPYEVRVSKNCCASPTNCPMSIQIQLGDTAITGGTSNLLIEKVY